MEKDFWVTEVLRSAATDREVRLPNGASGSVRFIFKGGTSLSRVFGIVDRFSEDVDLLAVFPDSAAPNARHAVLKKVDAELVTLAVTQSLLGHTSERRWLRYAKANLLGMFPDLPAQSGYNKRLSQLADTMSWLVVGACPGQAETRQADRSLPSASPRR